MTVARSRVLPVTRERVWEVVGDPYHEPRWWPRVQRVEGVSKRGWTSVLASPRGNAVRADWTLEESRAPVLRRWAQELEHSPFERMLRRHAVQVRARAGAGGVRDRGDADGRAGAARLGALRPVDGAPGGAADAGRRAGRARGGGALSRREQVPWGWGEPGAGPRLPPHAGAWLRAAFGVDGGVVTPPVPADAVRLRDAAPLPGGLRARLAEVVGEAHVRDDRATRLVRAAGKSYLDLLAIRSGDAGEAPDAVVAPGSHDEVVAVLQACNEHAVAVVPFGGGTSVTGGVAGDRGGLEAVVSLDLGRLDAVCAVDDRALTARVQAGVRLPEADFALARARAHGSATCRSRYEWATVGGCVATRSAGQSSTGHGRIDANLLGARLATPLGELATLPVPASAAGPDAAGAAGGVRGRARRPHRGGRCACGPLPAAERYEGFFVHDFGAGCDVLRTLAQAGAAPDVVRLSDEPETALSMALAGRSAVRDRLGTAVLRARGFASGCLLICGWEGPSEAAVAARRSAAVRALRRAGALAAGRGAGGGVARDAVRRAAPARRPDGPRGARGDARDGDDLGPAGADPRGGAGGAGPARRRTSAATSPTCTPRARRCTSRCSPAPTGRPRRAVAGGQGGRDGRHGRVGGDDHPPPRRRARPPRPGWPPRTAGWGWRCCARSRSGSTPRGS